MKTLKPFILTKMMINNKMLWTLFIAGAICFVSACGKDDYWNRKHIAEVNGEKIYLDEFQQRLNAQQGPLSPQSFKGSLNKQELLEEEILDSMITEKIVLQRARQLNLSVSNTELERKVLDIRKDFNDKFFDLLVSQNVRYEDWREELRKEMLFDKLVAVDVNASVSVSDEEAADYFDEHPDACKTETRVRAFQIVLRDPEKAKEIKARLEAGEDFAGIAARVSIGPEAARGGDLGWISRGTMPEPLDETLFRLPEGRVSPVIKSAYGYHILKVTEKRPSRARTFEECKGDLKAAILVRKQDEAFTAWLEKLKAKAVITKTDFLRQKKQK
jgi:parvulin-like peptidyl-prolyl isomerase